MDKVDDKKAKDKIIEAAIELFYSHGFQGTTVRKIAQRAKVNLALISYHFGGKKGLLEQLMVRFYEGYFKSIEEGNKIILLNKKTEASSMDQLILVMESAFTYLFDSYYMTRFIYRELSMDSTLIREIMTLYLAQEKYLYSSILEMAQDQQVLKIQDIEIFVLQLLNVLYMPFLQPQVIREVYYIEPHSAEFKSRYFNQIEQWIRNSFE
jgi:AcrR family transcriptional regulator